MFVHYRTRGFIFKKVDRGEADRIFTVFTKDFGKLELLAKAERKITSKLRAGLELFYLSEIEFIQGKTHKTLTDTILINNFKNLRSDLKRLKIAYQISEVLDKLVRGQEPDKKIWQLLNEVFDKLNSLEIKNWKIRIVYHYFLWNLLSILGYHPELYYCSLCQKKLTPENIFFNLKEGGLICLRCRKLTRKETTKRIKAETVKILRLILEKDLLTLKRLKIDKEELNQLAEISKLYLLENLRQIG